MKKEHIMYLTAVTLYGSNGILASLIPLGSYEIVLMRSLIGSIFLIAVFMASRRKLTCMQNRKHLGLILLSGASVGISWMFLYEAYLQVGVSIATLACYCCPIIVMTLSPVVFREKLTRPAVVGFMCVCLGMYLIYGTELARSGFSWGLVYGLLSAVAFAANIILNKKATSISGMENSMLQLIAATAVSALYTAMRHSFNMGAIGEGLLPLLILGVVNTGFGGLIFFSSIQKLPAATVSICGYLEPLTALILSALFLHEQLTVLELAGAACIIGGALLGESGLFFGKRRRLPG